MDSNTVGILRYGDGAVYRTALATGLYKKNLGFYWFLVWEIDRGVKIPYSIDIEGGTVLIL